MTRGQFGPRPLVNSDLFVMVNSDLIKYFSLVNSDLFHWAIRTLSVVNSDLFHWSIRTLPMVNSENFYWSVRTLLVVDSINLVKPNQSLWKIFPWNNNEKQLRNYLKKNTTKMHINNSCKMNLEKKFIRTIENIACIP